MPRNVLRNRQGKFVQRPHEEDFRNDELVILREVEREQFVHWTPEELHEMQFNGDSVNLERLLMVAR